jgi:hypothetical protein
MVVHRICCIETLGFPSKDWTMEQVASWLRLYKEGKFYCDSLGQADGEDLFGLDKEDLIRVLGDIRGPSLYSLLHSPKGMSQPQPQFLSFLSCTSV